MERANQLSNIIDSKEFIEATVALDYEENEVLLRNFALILTLVGVTSIDISANPNSIGQIKAGINDAILISEKLDINLNTVPFIKVSLGFLNPSDNRSYCLGSNQAIKDNLYLCLEAGSEIIELHHGNMEEDNFLSIWEIINELSSILAVSLSVNRVSQSNAHLINLINKAYDVHKENIILQVDGATSGGSDESYSSTLQSLATSDILIKELKIKDRRKFKKMKLTICGDINTKTTALALICNIDYSGISLGHHHVASHFEYLTSELSNTNLSKNMNTLETMIINLKQYLDKFRVLK